MNYVTKRADHIIKLAKEISRQFGQGFVGTEHLLLAIAREGTGLGSQILSKHGASEERLEEEIDKLAQTRLQETWVLGRIPGTPHFKDILNMAAQEARGQGNWQICSVHLLLALLSEKDSMGYKVLSNLGVSADGVRKALPRASTSA